MHLTNTFFLSFTRLLTLGLFGISFSVFANVTTTQPVRTANWVLTNQAGEQVVLYDTLRNNKTVVMLFWATWCKHCGQELPKLQTVADKYGEQADFYVINVWENGDANAMLSNYGIKLPLLLNGESVAARYGVTGAPELVAVTPDRMIRLHQTGPLNIRTLESYLASTLGSAQ